MPPPSLPALPGSQELFDQIYVRVQHAMSKYDGSHDMTHIKVMAIVSLSVHSIADMYSV